MATVVTINSTIAKQYFSNPELYKPTQVTSTVYKLYIPEANKIVSNQYKGSCAKTNAASPVIVEGCERDFNCMSLNSLAAYFTFADGSSINSESLKAKYKNPEKMGKATLEPKSGNKYIAVKPSPKLMNIRFVAIHVPIDVSFTLDDGTCVNDKRIKTHGKHGDYIVRAVGAKGMSKPMVINGTVFEHSFVLTSLNEATVVAADKKAIESLSDRYSY